MRRPQLEALLVDGKATNGGGSDFLIKVPERDMPAALQILAHLKASGVVTSYVRADVPNDTTGIQIFGYTGP